jgi:hypothetical protein
MRMRLPAYSGSLKGCGGLTTMRSLAKCGCPNGCGGGLGIGWPAESGGLNECGGIKEAYRELDGMNCVEANWKGMREGCGVLKRVGLAVFKGTWQ